MKRNLAIVPAFNEADSVAQTVVAIHQHAPGFDVLVVDDGSIDATAERAGQAGAEVLRMPFNLGIGGAMQGGYMYALEHGYQVAVQVDGDGQHDPRYLDELLAHLRSKPELNMVTGSRFLDAADKDGYRSSASRRIGIRVFSRILSIVVRRPITDPTSGLRMIDRRGIELFARDYPHDYPEVEAIVLSHSHRMVGEEVPVRMRARLTGRSSIGSTQSAYYMIKVLLAVFVGMLRARPGIEAGDASPVHAEHGL
jgi:glycosyltransferase involved in cell wall biosynthesis